jgi:hypothetical protein
MDECSIQTTQRKTCIRELLLNVLLFQYFNEISAALRIPLSGTCKDLVPWHFMFRSFVLFLFSAGFMEGMCWQTAQTDTVIQHYISSSIMKPARLCLRVRIAISKHEVVLSTMLSVFLSLRRRTTGWYN